MTEKKWNGNSQQFKNQERFTVIWSTRGMCLDHWSSNFPGAASPPPCWVVAACFRPDLSTHQSRDRVLLLQGSAWGPLGMTAAVVEVMIMIVIIINKTQALLSILHSLCHAGSPRGRHSLFVQVLQTPAVLWAGFLRDLVLPFHTGQFAGH